MAKFVDFYSDHEVKDIAEGYLNRYPDTLSGFDCSKVGFIVTRKNRGLPLKVHSVKYPMNVWMSQVYIFEVFEGPWRKLDQKRKNLNVFKAMCSIPSGGFDDQSKMYGKILKPEINMFMREYAASGGVVNWEENPAAQDPMDRTEEDVEMEIPVVEAIL